MVAVQLTTLASTIPSPTPERDSSQNTRRIPGAGRMTGSGNRTRSLRLVVALVVLLVMPSARVPGVEATAEEAAWDEYSSYDVEDHDAAAPKTLMQFLTSLSAARPPSGLDRLQHTADVLHPAPRRSPFSGQSIRNKEESSDAAGRRETGPTSRRDKLQQLRSILKQFDRLDAGAVEGRRPSRRRELGAEGSNGDRPEGEEAVMPARLEDNGGLDAHAERKGAQYERSRRTNTKRGTGACINNCLAGGMSFVRCKSMCN